MHVHGIHALALAMKLRLSIEFRREMSPGVCLAGLGATHSLTKKAAQAHQSAIEVCMLEGFGKLSMRIQAKGILREGIEY